MKFNQHLVFEILVCVEEQEYTSFRREHALRDMIVDILATGGEGEIIPQVEAEVRYHYALCVNRGLIDEWAGLSWEGHLYLSTIRDRLQELEKQSSVLAEGEGVWLP